MQDHSLKNTTLNITYVAIPDRSNDIVDYQSSSSYKGYPKHDENFDSFLSDFFSHNRVVSNYLLEQLQQVPNTDHLIKQFLQAISNSTILTALETAIPNRNYQYKIQLDKIWSEEMKVKNSDYPDKQPKLNIYTDKVQLKFLETREGTKAAVICWISSNSYVMKGTFNVDGNQLVSLVDFETTLFLSDNEYIYIPSPSPNREDIAGLRYSQGIRWLYGKDSLRAFMSSKLVKAIANNREVVEYLGQRNNPELRDPKYNIVLKYNNFNFEITIHKHDEPSIKYSFSEKSSFLALFGTTITFEQSEIENTHTLTTS